MLYLFCDLLFQRQQLIKMSCSSVHERWANKRKRKSLVISQSIRPAGVRKVIGSTCSRRIVTRWIYITSLCFSLPSANLTIFLYLPANNLFCRLWNRRWLPAVSSRSHLRCCYSCFITSSFQHHCLDSHSYCYQAGWTGIRILWYK